MSYTFRAICPKGLESLLQDELTQLGASSTKQSPGSVQFEGDMALAYKACLWSRLANRILYPISTEKVEDDKQLYQQVMAIDWGMHLDVKHSFRVDFRGTSKALNHEQYSARIVKDAIVDQFREDTGHRPDVDLKNPDIWLFAHLHKGQCQVSIDLSGPSLHRRGYRIDQGEAPIKENLAAALLIRAGWPSCEDDIALIDPLCGSGTLLIEGLLMRADIAPGLFREQFGFDNWLGHDERLWEQTVSDAKEREQAGRDKLTTQFIGFEVDKRTRRAAMANIGKLELEGHVSIQLSSFKDHMEQMPEALIISNPPYGERLGDFDSLMPVYKDLGKWLKHQLKSRAALITSEPELMQQTGIRAGKRYKFYNGKLACQLYCFDLIEENFINRDISPDKNPILEPLINRLNKNIKKVSTWAKKNDLQAYRIYDHDLPEYAFAVDKYLDYLLLYESAAPKHVPQNAIHKHRREFLSALSHVTGVHKNALIIKTREKKKGKNQYERHAKKRHLEKVREQGLRFNVNLYDYLDTGLFIDHRYIRARIRSMCDGKRFLNLFCYTGAVSVYAADGGAVKTTSVDLSNTYLNWAKDNMKLNGLERKQHEFIKADVTKWLKSSNAKYDVIFLDPPSFSNSKSMEHHFDILEDHPDLIKLTMSLLAPGGTLIFSTNRKGFKIAQSISDKFHVTDLGDKTISPDFRKHRPPHHCWDIRHKEN